MFDIDSGKLLIVAVLALIVIGPKELPRVMRQVGQAVGKMRRMANEFQGQFMDAMKEADIADIRKELNELNTATALDYHFDPVRDIQSELTGAVSDKPATTGEATVPSPAEHFELPPSAPAETETLVPVMAEAIAPVVEPEAAAATLSALNGHASPMARALAGKRKIIVKRRRSSFSVVRRDEAARSTGEPFLVRERSVRAKPALPSDGLSS
jgi:sec-independent protein translocase protein TatB